MCLCVMGSEVFLSQHFLPLKEENQKPILSIIFIIAKDWQKSSTSCCASLDLERHLACSFSIFIPCTAHMVQRWEEK